MDDLTSAMRALALAFERRGLDLPVVQISREAGSALSREITPQLVVDVPPEDLRRGDMRIAGVKLEVRRQVVPVESLRTLGAVPPEYWT